MKKIIMITALLLMLTACGSSASENEQETTEITTEYVAVDENSEDESSEDETIAEESEYAPLILGIWTNDKNEIYVFNDDKTFNVDSPEGNYNGTYSIVSGGERISLAMAVNVDDVRVYSVKFGDNNKKIMLTDEDGDNIELVSAKENQ